jgi:HNH endonuclease
MPGLRPRMSDPDASVKCMFDIKVPGQAAGGVVQPGLPPDSDLAGPVLSSLAPPAPRPAGPVPLERLESQLCEVAGHLAAATCRFLVLLAEFDERRGWASWELGSCAAWLSWRCQLSSGTAREHVRVARALRELPVIRREFAAARFSYAKVRALTRIATPATEEQLAVMAAPMTANQLERFARAHRQCSRADDAARIRRRLTWRFEEDGSLSGSFRLPPLDGAVLLKALRAAAAEADPAGGAEPADVSAETPPPSPPAADLADPASPARCHVEDGAAISVTTAQMLTCTAALSWMLHGRDGKILSLGRRRRRPDKALRKAARERDRGRCRYPGCESRRVDLHHIRHWASGGRTDLDNLISLCKKHIGDVHDAEVTLDTIIPPWSGERLDLDYAIYTCLANEKVLKDRAAGRDPGAGIPPCDCHVGEAAELFVSPHRDGAPFYLPVEV